MLNQKIIEADFCVVGGGIAGMCAAISAARHGAQVVLIHERPVLGGNASSEIRVWISGAHGEDNRETGILEEIALENLYRNPTKNWYIWDTVLYDFVKREKNITLLLNCTCIDAECESGDFADGRNTRIKSVTGYMMTTQTKITVKAKFFSDCSGDSILAPLTGAEFRIGRESADEFGEDTHVKFRDNMTMGNSCLIQGREGTQSVKYTHPDGFKKFTDKDFEFRPIYPYNSWENYWYLELGGNRDTVNDAEEIADELRELALGTWDYMKNSGKYDVANWDLEFLGFLPGKRESRRMVGEYIINERDVSECRRFEDTVAYGGWPIDDHFPMGFYHKNTANTDFKTPAPYPLPYRALYSKNVENLFFAGRNISMTHMAMSSIRVMATCGLLGQAVGTAAALACEHGLTPNEVYKNKDMLGELKRRLMDDDCYLPFNSREVAESAVENGVGIDAGLHDGNDRVHRLIPGKAVYTSELGCALEYKFNNAEYVDSVHVVFDSDLNRQTLPGNRCEQEHSTRANVLLNSPQMHMPTTLIKEFSLCVKFSDGNERVYEVKNNRKRAYHFEVKDNIIGITLTPSATWGSENARIISFDYR